MAKVALITGITGQDGSYLAELLLEKGYIVHGIKRRSSSLNTERIDHIYQDYHESNKNFHLHYGDLTDSLSVFSLIQKIRPDEVYNLGAQSHVGVSFENPEYTGNVVALGALRLLDSIRQCGLAEKTKFYQASSSELYGKVQEIPQTENTQFYPRSPYGVAKLYAYWITVNYRESYNMFACNGILFNHESPRRGETFVTRKITRGLARIALGIDKCLYLGNLEALRDWGHAKDYVEMQWLMLQQNNPKDYVISSGVECSVRDFVKIACEKLGIEITFKNSGLEEIGYITSLSNYADNLKVGQEIIKVSEKYFRPAEVDRLLGDSTLAKDQLNWVPKISVDELCEEMINHDLKKEMLTKR